MYRIHLPTLTVIRHADGEDFDLNAQGEPCRTVGDLRAFVKELHAQGAYGAATRDRLLADVRREHRGGSRKGHPNVGGTRDGSGRRPDPRITADDARALLASLVPGATTPADYARALGCRPERVREALRGGCTVRRADEWKRTC